jgi:hypothetical protein
MWVLAKSVPADASRVRQPDVMAEGIKRMQQVVSKMFD